LASNSKPRKRFMSKNHYPVLLLELQLPLQFILEMKKRKKEKRRDRTRDIGGKGCTRKRERRIKKKKNA